MHEKRGDTEAVTLVHIFVYNLHLDTGVAIRFLSASQCSLAPVNGTVIWVRQAILSTASTLVHVSIHV